MREQQLRCISITELWWVWDLVCFLITMTPLNSAITENYFLFLTLQNTFLLLTLFISNRRKLSCFPLLTSSLLTPNVGFSTPSNSDTNFLELVQTLQVKSLVSENCPLLPLQIPTASPGFRCASNWSATNRTFPHPLLRFDNLWEQLTELRKALYLLLPVYYKIQLRNSQMEGMHRTGS